MITNLATMQLFLKDKSICLLGNSKNILKTPKQIDTYDIVCRINRGTPLHKEEFLGTRTDVLFLATKMEEKTITKDFNPEFVVWTTKSIVLQTDWVKENAIQNPPEDWQELRDNLNTLPSTGCVSIVFLLKHIKFATLTIYGFDFFQSGTWYHNCQQSWHNGTIEEIFITNLIKNDSRIQLIRE
jgi:hypothetical protein